MSVTLVSETIAQRAGGPPLPPGIELPAYPSYVLLSRPGGSEPIRIEAEDAVLLMWILSKLGQGMGRMVQPMPPSGDYGLI
jgi:hypothetical protein